MAWELIKVSEDEAEAMVEEYKLTRTSRCPRCGAKSQPWGGMWACECGASAMRLDAGPGQRREGREVRDGE